MTARHFPIANCSQLLHELRQSTRDCDRVVSGLSGDQSRAASISSCCTYVPTAAATTTTTTTTTNTTNNKCQQASTV